MTFWPRRSRQNAARSAAEHRLPAHVKAHLKTINCEAKLLVKPPGGVVRQDTELSAQALLLLPPVQRGAKQSRPHAASSIMRQHIHRVNVQRPLWSEDGRGMEDVGFDQTDGQRLRANRLGDLQQMIGGTGIRALAVFVAAQRLQDAAFKIQPGDRLIGQFATTQRVHLTQHRLDKPDDGGEVVRRGEPELKVEHISYLR